MFWKTNRLLFIDKTKFLKNKLHLVYNFVIPKYIAQFDDDAKWIRFASHIHKYKNAFEQLNELKFGFKFEKLTNEPNGRKNVLISLPGSDSILRLKDQPIFCKFDFWSCNDGIVMPRYIDFCSILFISSTKNFSFHDEDNVIASVSKRAMHSTSIIIY